MAILPPPPPPPIATDVRRRLRRSQAPPVRAAVLVAYAMMVPLPESSQQDQRKATCNTKSLLACAFATWIPFVPRPATIALLFDCESSGRAAGVTTPLNATSAVGDDAVVVPDAVRMPPWLQRADLVNLTIKRRCLYGGVCARRLVTRDGARPVDNRSGHVRRMCGRGAIALFKWLFAEVDADFYVKLDSDALIMPEALHWLLARWNHRHHYADRAAPSHAPESTSPRPMYPSVRSARVARLYYGNMQHSFRLFQCHSQKRTCLRSTDDWSSIESHMGWDMSERARAARPSEVTYASGGVYVMSRGALTAAVERGCLERVTRVRCSGWPGEYDGDEHACEWGVEHEDLMVGLCMHLANASAFTSSCFARNPTSCPHPLSSHSHKSSQRYWMAFSKLHPRVRRLVRSLHHTDALPGYGRPGAPLLQPLDSFLSRVRETEARGRAATSLSKMGLTVPRCQKRCDAPALNGGVERDPAWRSMCKRFCSTTTGSQL